MDSSPVVHSSGSFTAFPWSAGSGFFGFLLMDIGTRQVGPEVARVWPVWSITMPSSLDDRCPQCADQNPAGLFGWGMLTGLAGSVATLLARRALAQAAVGQGHSLKHRVLDFAASV